MYLVYCYFSTYIDLVLYQLRPCRLGWYGVLGIYLFFALNILINKFIMSAIVSVIFQQERKEGDFR